MCHDKVCRSIRIVVLFAILTTGCATLNDGRANADVDTIELRRAAAEIARPYRDSPNCQFAITPIGTEPFGESDDYVFKFEGGGPECKAILGKINEKAKSAGITFIPFKTFEISRTDELGVELGGRFDLINEVNTQDDS